MKTGDFFKTLTSTALSESFEKQFGSKVNLDKYTREQLEDMRNKIRTRVFQQESSARYNDLLTNETYQKDQAMLQLLNTRIKEMLGENIKKLRDKMVELSEAKKGTRPPKTRIKPKGSKPDFLDLDKDGDKKEPMKKASKEKKVAEAEKKETTWTDKSGKKHPATQVKGDKYTGKEAEQEKKVSEAEKKETTWTDKSGKKHPATKVKGDKYTGKEAEQEKKATKADEGVVNELSSKTRASYANKARVSASGNRAMADLHREVGDEEGAKKYDAKAKKRDAGYEKVAGPVKKHFGMKENFKRNVKIVNEALQTYIAEDEEGKAKAITAASDMVNDFTSWMQRVGQYQTKAIIELADAIRADFGIEESERFKETVSPALATTLETLTQQREVISNAVAVLAGEDLPQDQMGMEPDMELPPEPGMELAPPDEMNAGDEFGASDAAAGGPEASGREMRESRFARKLAESHSIIAKLAK